MDTTQLPTGPAAQEPQGPGQEPGQPSGQGPGQPSGAHAAPPPRGTERFFAAIRDLGVERDPARREGLAVFKCLFWAEVPKRTDPVQRRSEGDVHLVRATLLLCVVMMVSGSYIEGDEMMVDPR